MSNDVAVKIGKTDGICGSVAGRTGTAGIIRSNQVFKGGCRGFRFAFARALAAVVRNIRWAPPVSVCPSGIREMPVRRR
jgi:hypothetical protein